MSRHDGKGPSRLLQGNALRHRDTTQERFDALAGPVEVRQVEQACTECGNDIATVTITSGQRVCLDCAERLDP